MKDLTKDLLTSLIELEEALELLRIQDGDEHYPIVQKIDAIIAKEKDLLLSISESD